MKKRITLVLAVLTMLLLVVTLASCGALKNNPAAMWLRINRAMNKLDSYEMASNMKMTFYVNGQEVTGTAKGKAIEAGIGEKDYYFYQKTSTTVYSKKLSINETTSSIEAYHEGNYFISNQGKKVNQRVYSPMSLKDAKKYRLESGVDLSILFLEVEHTDVTKNEDGTTTLTYSGYTEESLDKIAQMMGVERDTFGKDMVDVQVSITVDEDYRIVQISLVFSFDVAENSSIKPELSIDMTYSQYNAAERETKSLNVENFTKIDDVRILTQLEDMLEQRMESKNGSFTLETQQKTTMMGSHTIHKETDKVTYGEGDDGYYYEIDAVLNGVDYDISYKNGKQTIKSEAKNQTNNQKEDEARDYINNLINTAYYNPDHVTEITEVSDGVYKIVSDKPVSTPYESFYASMKASYLRATQTITITVEDGRIVKIVNEVEALGSLTSGYNSYQISLEIDSTVTFDD